jgi:hypothetical protein
VIAVSTTAEIFVAGASDPELLGGIWKKVKVEDLKRNLTELVDGLRDVLPQADASAQGFRLEEFEVAVTVNAKGEVGLFGTGAEVGGEASLTLRFKKV